MSRFCTRSIFILTSIVNWKWMTTVKLNGRRTRTWNNNWMICIDRRIKLWKDNRVNKRAMVSLRIREKNQCIDVTQWIHADLLRCHIDQQKSCKPIGLTNRINPTDLSSRTSHWSMRNCTLQNYWIKLWYQTSLEWAASKAENQFGQKSLKQGQR